MKKLLPLITVALIVALGFSGSAKAGIDTVTLKSHENKSGEAWAIVTDSGTTAVTFELGLASGTVADIRGFFFDIDGNIDSIACTALTDINNDFTISNVITSWPDVSGSAGMQGAGTFDVGIEFGKAGIGNNKGDIRAVTFTVTGAYPLNIGNNFGMRLMSFGDNRQDSRKMIGKTPPPPHRPRPRSHPARWHRH